MTINPIWTSEKSFEVFWTWNEDLATWKPFSIEGAQQFMNPLKQLCTLIFHIECRERLVHGNNYAVSLLALSKCQYFQTRTYWTVCNLVVHVKARPLPYLTYEYSSAAHDRPEGTSAVPLAGVLPAKYCVTTQFAHNLRVVWQAHWPGYHIGC